MINLSKKATEKSSYIVTVTFTDENGSSVVPNTIKWTLSDTKGNAVNSRKDIVVSQPAASIDIVLTGDDLSVFSTTGSEDRVVTVIATYDSTYGDDLNLTQSAKFNVENLIVI